MLSLDSGLSTRILQLHRVQIHVVPRTAVFELVGMKKCSQLILHGDPAAQCRKQGFRGSSRWFWL